MAQDGYERGQGPNQLPYGEATRLNQSQVAPAGFGNLALENTDIPVQFAPEGPDAIPEDDTGEPDDLQILLDHPDPGYRPRALPRERPGRQSRYVVRHIAQLKAMASLPDAPPAVRGKYNTVIRQAEEERRAGL